MSGKFSIFDGLGNYIGEIPNTGAEGCGIFAIVLFIILLALSPIVNVLGPPIFFAWTISRPSGYPNKALLIILASIFLFLWGVGVLALIWQFLLKVLF